VTTSGTGGQSLPSATNGARVLLFPLRRGPHREGGDASGGHQGANGLFHGMKVLVVEDDFIVAYDMQSMLEEQGAEVIGPASSLQEARALLADSQPNAAVLDVNLNGEYVFPLAEDLRARGIPFLFATAYTDDDRLFPPATKQVLRLAKPVLPNVLISQLRKLLA
jgi:two-component system, response regulator PdtaR